MGIGSSLAFLDSLSIRLIYNGWWCKRAWKVFRVVLCTRLRPGPGWCVLSKLTTV